MTTKSSNCISILIATYNREHNLRSCILSILRNSFTNYEILILDQSNNNLSKQCIAALHNQKIRYIKFSSKGKSKALNQGILSAKGNILYFIDDDCILGKKSLSELNSIFLKYHFIEGVFGKTTPYQPQSHKGKNCPCCFDVENLYLINNPIYHANYIGFGNNMAFKKELFNIIGGFKPWLGPGSFSFGAEDAELALRTLIYGHSILSDPKMIVYHNKWLSPEEMKKQQLSYVCGEMSCYGYYYFLGYQFAKSIVWNNINDSYFKIRQIIKNLLFFKWNNRENKFIFFEILYRIRGLIIGYLYTFINPIQKQLS
jgi:glycosyltransferase involved in cell wall biosynthesis